MSIFAKSKSPFASQDRIGDGGGSNGDGALQRQASQLLCDRDCNAAFSARISQADGSANMAKGAEIVPSEQLAHAAEGGAQGLNINAEQAVKMLDMHPSTELYAQLEKLDQQQAVDLAVRDNRFEQMSASSDNLAVQDEVKQRRYAVPAA